MPILLALVVASAIQAKRSNPFGEMSRLGNMPSTLLSASYLYQGLPDEVFGLDFKYADSKNLRHEDYLEKLLDNEAVGSRRDLKEDVIFLANRLYVDKKYEKSYLLMGRVEARNRLTDLIYLDQSRFSHEDQLLLKTLQTFFALAFNRKDAIATWQAIPRANRDHVWTNVNDLAKKIVVADQIQNSWVRLQLWR